MDKIVTVRLDEYDKKELRRLVCEHVNEIDRHIVIIEYINVLLQRAYELGGEAYK